MKISETEIHHEQLMSSENNIRTMVNAREYPSVFDVCLATLPHIVPSIKFRKKRNIEPETPRFSAISVICKYGPPLFEHDFIAMLLDFIKETRVLAKHENGYLQKVESALEREEEARILWNYYAAHPGNMQRNIRKETGIDQENAVAILKIWEELGIAVRIYSGNNYEVYLSTQADAKMKGICLQCGFEGMGKRDLLFKPIRCQKCGTEEYYHVVYPEYL